MQCASAKAGSASSTAVRRAGVSARKVNLAGDETIEGNGGAALVVERGRPDIEMHGVVHGRHFPRQRRRQASGLGETVGGMIVYRLVDCNQNQLPGAVPRPA